MDCLWRELYDLLKVVGSYLVALARLVIWTIIFFFTGLQRTLFMRSEVVGIEFKVTPLRCDIEDTDEKLSYIDKLCMENPDLVEGADESIGEDMGEWLDEEDGEEDNGEE